MTDSTATLSASVSLTARAARRVAEILASEDQGRCCGYCRGGAPAQYGFSLDDSRSEMIVLERDGAVVLIDHFAELSWGQRSIFR